VLDAHVVMTIFDCRHAVLITAILQSVLLLQGCDHRAPLQYGPKGTSLLQVPGSSRKRRHEAPAARHTETPAEPAMTELADEVTPAQSAMPMTALADDDEAPVAEPVMAAKPHAVTELADDDEAPVAEPIIAPKPPAAHKKHDWGVLLQEEDNRQQDELQDQYQAMIDTDDPDKVDKMMKAAWGRMQNEDRQFTTAFSHTHKSVRRPTAPRAPPSALIQRSDRLFASFGSERLADEAAHPKPKRKRRKRLMLNQRQATVRRQTAAVSLPRLAAAQEAPKDQRMDSLTELAALPPTAALDAEAAVAEDADF